MVYANLTKNGKYGIIKQVMGKCDEKLWNFEI